MTLEQSAIPVFAGHHTFHPRFGWIKKGFDAITGNPDVFNMEEAPLVLGVGKNMVEAIRFWGIAARTWCRVPHPTENRSHLHVPTGFGRAMLADDGFDPYLEVPGTLWLLHWYALSPPTSLPVWWLTFNELSAVEFSDEDLDRFCIERVSGTTWRQPNESSVKKDVDCLLRMYTQRAVRGRQTIDDLLDSPFRELELIVPSGLGPNRFRFALGSKSTLPAEVLAYACLDFMALTDPNARSATVSRLTSDPGSPGRLFKLTEQALLDGLEQVAAKDHTLTIGSPGGSPQLLVDGDTTEVAQKLLKRYYGARSTRPGKGLRVGFAGSLGRLPVDSNALVSPEQPTRRRKVVVNA